MVNNKLGEYKYLYETHLHTSESSKCAIASAVDMAKALKAAGYTGMFVSDHNWGGNTAIDSELSWEQWVIEFCKGYEAAKEWGDKNDFDVFFAYEAGYEGTEFLIYGVDKEWLISHPAIKTATVEEQYKLVHEAGGMVIHAHPYREEYYIPEIRLFPEYVDGIEAVNATHSNPKSKAHNNPKFDASAIQYGKEHGFPMTAGSDVHSTNLFDGGVAFKERLTSAKDYCERILSKKDYLLTNGVDYIEIGDML